MQNKLAEIRKLNNFTQEELSDKSGISRPYISDIERGRQTTITNVVMKKLARALNRNVEEIFFTRDVV